VNAKSPSLTARQLAAGQPAGQLRPVRDAELGVDPGQVRLDGADADEEVLGHLPVRAAGGHERGDLFFGGSQAAGLPPAANPGELVPRPRGQRRAAQLVQPAGRFDERLPGLAELPEPAPRRAESKQRPGVVEGKLQLLVLPGGRLQIGDGLLILAAGAVDGRAGPDGARLRPRMPLTRGGALQAGQDFSGGPAARTPLPRRCPR
jgi:hypothetical protein